MESYRDRIEEILSYRPKHPNNRNGHNVGILFRANIIAATLRSWAKDPVTEKMLKQQGYTDGIVTVGDRNYPVRILREMEDLKNRYPNYFQT